MSNTALCATACMAIACTLGCDVVDAPDASDEDARITVATQSVTLPPRQDPQLCNIPSGRYAVLATPTSWPGVFDVFFHNDAVQGNPLSGACKSMIILWNEAVAPVAPVPTPLNLFHAKLIEGWWVNGPPGTRHFAAKAVHQTPHNQGVVTAVNSIPASAYFLIMDDFGIAYNVLFNCVRPGTNSDHVCVMPDPLPGQTSEWNDTIAITGSNQVPVQRLFLETGSSRLAGGTFLATRPCIPSASAVCPPSAPP